MFSNLSSYYIIDVDTILSESGLDVTKKSHQYLLNSELERLLATGAKSKRYRGLIYINSNIACDVVESVRQVVLGVNNTNIDDIVIIDDYDVPKLKDYYSMFDSVEFFRVRRRGKVINCVPRSAPKIQLHSND